MSKKRKHGEAPIPSYRELSKKVRRDWGDVDPRSRIQTPKTKKPNKHKKKQTRIHLQGSHHEHFQIPYVMIGTACGICTSLEDFAAKKTSELIV